MTDEQFLMRAGGILNDEHSCCLVALYLIVPQQVMTTFTREHETVNRV